MIRLDHAHLQVAALSHPGLSGKNNEDRFAVSAFRLNAKDPIPALFAVLADGIGGHRAGEIAAEMAVNIISHQVAESDGQNPLQVMAAAFQDASRSIYEHAQGSPDRRGMGATCACAWVIGNQLYTATVGDSRIYLLRGQAIQQISTDHTWIQEALDRGAITPEQARGHPNAHVIRRYLGSAAPAQTDLRLRLHPGENEEQSLANQGVELHPGDLLLLCSDGLTDLVSDQEIQATLLSPASGKAQPTPGPQPLEVGIQALVDQACLRGGNDNITVIVMRLPQMPIPTRPVGRQPLAWRRAAAISCIGVVSLIVLAIAVWLGFNWSNRPSGTPSATAGLASPVASTPAPATPSASVPIQSPTPGLPTRLATAGPTLTPWPTHTQPAAPSHTPAVR